MHVNITFKPKEDLTPSGHRILFLTNKLGFEIDELVERKGGKDLEHDVPLQISKQDLNNIYFAMKEELEKRREYYFGGEL